MIGGGALNKSAFAWAKSCIDQMSKVPEVSIKNIERYTEKVGQHFSLYRDDETDQTYSCIFLEGRLYFQKITNYPEIMKKPVIVGLLLRNGEYLFTKMTGGSGSTVVNIAYFDK